MSDPGQGAILYLLVTLSDLCFPTKAIQGKQRINKTLTQSPEQN